MFAHIFPELFRLSLSILVTVYILGSCANNHLIWTFCAISKSIVQLVLFCGIIVQIHAELTSRTVTRKFSTRGLHVCAGGLDTVKTDKTPLIYRVSYFNLGGAWCIFWGGLAHQSPYVATGLLTSCAAMFEHTPIQKYVFFVEVNVIYIFEKIKAWNTKHKFLKFFLHMLLIVEIIKKNCQANRLHNDDKIVYWSTLISQRKSIDLEALRTAEGIVTEIRTRRAWLWRIIYFNTRSDPKAQFCLGNRIFMLYAKPEEGMEQYCCN